jgi:purine-binding chemotaxis protein CheW
MSDILNENQMDYVTFRIAGQDFGLDVALVRDVFEPKMITRVPKARAEVFGVLNLRGRIVTVIDMRTRLGIGKFDDAKAMCIVIDHGDQPYALMVDSIGDVMSMASNTFDDVPPTLDDCWANVARGVHRLPKKGMLVILSLEKVMGFVPKKTQAIDV